MEYLTTGVPTTTLGRRDQVGGPFLSCVGEKLRLREATGLAKVTHLAWKEQGCSAGRGGAGGDRWTTVPVLALHTCSEARVGDFSLALTVKPQLPQTLTLLT